MGATPGRKTVEGKFAKTSFLPTVQQLIDEDEIVFDVLFGNFAKVGLHNVDDFEQELKDHSGVDILFCHRGEPYVGSLYVEERSSGYVGYRRANLLTCMDDVDAKSIDGIPADIVAIHTRNENLSLVVVNEQTPDHCDGGC